MRCALIAMPVRVEVPLIVKDPEVTEWKGVAPTEPFVIQTESVYLDGPVTPRVAVLDFDEKTGELRPGVRFAAPATAEGLGRYEPSAARAVAGEIVPREHATVSVFGTVLKTMEMFESPDSLGRRVAWAFGEPQLLVVPRAGEWANAFYERESHSLQFFYFRAEDGRTVHTSHSQDIVAHETAHAVLDGIAPDLYNSISPQSLGIHEAVADLAAVISAFRSRAFSEEVLRQTGGRIDNSNAFNGIAEQFATALDETRGYLRQLWNRKSLRPDAKKKDRVDRSDPHAVSEVLSGALYSVMVRMHEALRKEYAASKEPRRSLVAKEETGYQQLDLDRQKGAPEESVTEEPGAEPGRSPRGRVAMKALYVAAQRLKRMISRGLDYLPPGDVSFADLGRAILAADQASHPESGEQRAWLREEFVRRGIVARERELEVKTNFRRRAVTDLDLEALVDSDWVAYQFANAHRALLRIPASIPFEVHPRLDVTKVYWHREGPTEVRECLFKVSWTRVEPNLAGRGLPRRRRVIMGTTLAIDWKTRLLRARLTSDAGASQRADRDRLLRYLVDEGILRLGEEACGADGMPLRGAVRGDVIGGVLRIRSAARVLHLHPVGAA